MKRSLSLSAAAMLAGCAAVGPDYRQPGLAVPARYAEATAYPGGLSDAELSAWWHSFGDTQLDSLIARAIALNLDVQAAAARLREARAQEAVAGARTLPEVDAQASASRQRISENAIPLPPGTPGGSPTGFGLPGSEFSSFHVGLDASWEIDLFGGTRRGIEAARARTGSALWTRRDLQASTAAEIANAYFTLRTIQQRIANAESDLARQQRDEQLVKARFIGGLVSGIDLEQQKSERATTAAELPTLKAQADAQIHAIGLLTGTTPEALITELSPPHDLPATIPDIPAGLPSDLLRRRPDIRAAERDLAAATADIGVATADLYPKFSLTAAPALVSTTLGKLLDWGSRNYSAGVGLLWPLFDGGRARANIAVADARQEQALIAYRKTVLTALGDVEDALNRIEADRGRLAQLEESQAAASRAEGLSLTRYRGGLVDYGEVLANRGLRLGVEKQMIETRGSLARDSAALFKALGGGWPMPEQVQ